MKVPLVLQNVVIEMEPFFYQKNLYKERTFNRYNRVGGLKEVLSYFDKHSQVQTTATTKLASRAEGARSMFIFFL